MTYIQTLTKSSKAKPISSFISKEIKKSLALKLDLDITELRKIRIINRIINKSTTESKYNTIISDKCHQAYNSLKCECMTIKLQISLYLPKNEANCLTIDLQSGRLFNPLHKNSESYLFTNVNSLVITKSLKMKPTHDLPGPNFFNKAIFLTEPIYRISQETRALIVPGTGIFLADPQIGRIINYKCTFTNKGGIITKNSTNINASKQGIFYYYNNCEMSSHGNDNLLSESTIISNPINVYSKLTSNNKKAIMINIESFKHENLFKNSNIIINDKSIKEIQFEISSSMDAEATLNNRISDLEGENFIQKTIKKYCNIAFISLLLFAMISLIFILVSCTCRNNIIDRIGNSDKDKDQMIKHIARLEKYVMGIDKEEFHNDIIDMQIKHDTSQKSTKEEMDEDASSLTNKNELTSN